MEGDPHAVLEGMLIAAYAIGAHEGYIYVRAEYPLAVKRLRIAIAAAEERGLLGDDVARQRLGLPPQDQGGRRRLRLRRGDGADRLHRGQARHAAHAAAVPGRSGLWGKPTNINNVETWANVPWIIANGAAAVRRLRQRDVQGHQGLRLAGKIVNGGLVEVPMGSTLRHVIFDVGGGIKDGKKFKAVQIGGPSGGCVPASLLDTPVDYESLAATGAIMGSGGMVVVDDSTCMVDLARYFLQFTQDESCGKCVPCRVGTKRMLEILERITAGDGRGGRHRAPRELAREHQEDEPLRPGPDGAQPGAHHDPLLPRRVRGAHRRAAAARRSRARRSSPTSSTPRPAPAARCAPRSARSTRPPATKKQPHIIDQALCIRCDACRAACKFDAVKVVSGPEEIAAAVARAAHLRRARPREPRGAGDAAAASPAPRAFCRPTPCPPARVARIVRWVTNQRRPAATSRRWTSTAAVLSTTERGAPPGSAGRPQTRGVVWQKNSHSHAKPAASSAASR